MRESLLNDYVDVSRSKARGKTTLQGARPGKFGSKSGADQAGRNAGDEKKTFAMSLLHNFRQKPGSVLFTLAIIATSIAISTNALLLQSDRHPAPFFAKNIAAVTADPVRKPQRQPVAANRQQFNRSTSDVQPGHDRLASPAKPETSKIIPHDREQKFASQTKMDIGALIKADTEVPRQVGPARDLIGSLITSKGAPPRPPANIPRQKAGEISPSQKQRTAAMQRALVKLGYKLTVDGVAGPATQAALEQFQRSNRLPHTGGPGDRTLQVLASRSRIAIP